MLPPESTTSPKPDPPDSAPPEPLPAPAVDLPALATKIYALLKEDLRLERERSGRAH